MTDSRDLYIYERERGKMLSMAGTAPQQPPDLRYSAVISRPPLPEMARNTMIYGIYVTAV